MWQFTMLTLVTLAMFIGNSHASAAPTFTDESSGSKQLIDTTIQERGIDKYRYTVLRKKVEETDDGDSSGKGDSNLISEIF